MQGKRRCAQREEQLELAGDADQALELYRATGEERYLEQARLFVERRGRGVLGEHELGQAYFQDVEAQGASLAVCVDCGANYSVETPPKYGWVCDNCGGEVVQRADDTPEVVESVNDALTFYDASSNQFTPAISLSEFYGLPPTIDRTTGRFGPFVR